jgi:hypothetical protein
MPTGCLRLTKWFATSATDEAQLVRTGAGHFPALMPTSSRFAMANHFIVGILRWVKLRKLICRYQTLPYFCPAFQKL